MYSQIKLQLTSLNNSTYINKINNIKFKKDIKLQKQQLGTFIYNILQISNINNIKFSNKTNIKYLNTNITKIIKHTLSQHHNSNYIIESPIYTLEDELVFNKYVDIISALLTTQSTNNFSSHSNKTNKLKEDNVLHVEIENPIDTESKYLKTDIVNINHIDNWFIIDEYIHNMTENSNFNSINKYSNSLNNYVLTSSFMLELYYNDILISICFNKHSHDNNYINITIEFDMKANIKSNIIHKYIDSVIYILQSIDTSLTIIE